MTRRPERERSKGEPETAPQSVSEPVRVSAVTDEIIHVQHAARIPYLRINLPWWRRLQIAYGILFLGSAALPELESRK